MAELVPVGAMPGLVRGDAVCECLCARDRARDGGEPARHLDLAAVDRVEDLGSGGVFRGPDRRGPPEANERGRRGPAQESAPTSGCQGQS